MPARPRSRLGEWFANPLTGRWLPLPPRTPAERLASVLLGRHARMVVIALGLLAFVVALGQGATAVAAALPVAWALVFAVQFVRMRRLVREGNRAVAAVNAGDLERGAALLAPIARSPLAGAALSHSLGVVQIQLGHHREAVRALARSWRSEGPLREQAPELLALAYAFSGALDEADAWAAEARRRRKADVPAGGLLLVVDAIIALRRSDARRAASLLDVGWGELEGTLLARFYRGVRVLRAFAIEAATGGPSPTSAALLAGVRPSFPGEFAWLGAEWPEMRNYLESSGLAKA